MGNETAGNEIGNMNGSPIESGNGSGRTNENANADGIETVIEDVNGNEKNKRKKRIVTALFVLLNIAVVAWTAIDEFSGKHAGSSEVTFSQYALLYLGGAFLCLIILFLAETLKYWLMMRALGEKESFRVAFETAALGKYYDCITPSGAGGQPFQIYWLHKHGYSDGASSAMPLAGYITMQGGFVLLALAFFITWRSVDIEAFRFTAYFGLLLIAVLPVLFVLFSIMPGAIKKLLGVLIRLGTKLRLIKNPGETTERLLDMLDQYQKSIKALAKSKGTLLALLALSVVYRVALCSIPFFVLRMFNASVDFLPVFASTVYIYASVALIATPGNAGAAEGSFYLVFSAMQSNGVFWPMLVWRLFSHYSFIIVGAAVYGVNALQKKRGRGGETT